MDLIKSMETAVKNNGSDETEISEEVSKEKPTSKFKSKLEEDFNNFLIKQKIQFGYEDYKAYLSLKNYLSILLTLTVQQ